MAAQDYTKSRSKTGLFFILLPMLFVVSSKNSIFKNLVATLLWLSHTDDSPCKAIFRGAYALVFIAFLFCSCSNSETNVAGNFDSYPEIESEADTLADMVRIHSTGAETFLGTTVATAKANERPQMKTFFDYDFSIAQHETTCSEFNSLMGMQLPCEQNGLPVTNVTYYDAVLFANAKSKSERLDTAYLYTATTFDKDGHCVGMEGFKFDASANAYRLPTESEWILVASQGWTPKEAWNAENSNYKVHPVCTAGKNKVNVCDMEGNVKEWVNDWLGHFSTSPANDFLGAPDGGGIGERVVKGGSYRDEESSINVYSRGDVYLVTSANTANYIGFRLAFGAIPNPTWIDRNGNINDNPIVALANSSTIRKLMGSYQTKLVFRNDVTGNLAFIDYTNVPASVTEIEDSLDVYHPDISPNGDWVAFCTGLEGVSGKSTVYVRNISNPASPATRLDVESAAIPRWRITTEGDTAIVYVTDAGNNKNDADFFAKSTWQVTFANGKFGPPQKLFDGAYHGGLDENGIFAVTGARLLRVRITDAPRSQNDNAHDTIWYNEEQACNASMSKDGSKRTAFLDFGGKTGQDFVGKSYATHERLLIADSTGKLIQSVESPSGYTFDHSEWSNEGIVATIANSDGAHTKIVYVNLEDSSIVELAEGEELWHPSIWTAHKKQSADNNILNLDSAGLYYGENAKFCVYELRKKMEHFWTQLNSFNVVAFGSSRTLFGLDPREMRHNALLNFGYSGGDMIGSEYLFENYILNHKGNVKYIVVEITPNAFWRMPEHDWNSIYNMNAGFHYDESHNFWKDGIPEGFIDAVIESPTFLHKETLPYRDEFSLPSISWLNPVLENDPSYTPYDAFMVEDNFRRFGNIVNKASEAGIKVIALNYPVHPGYGNLYMVGPYGPSNEVAKKVLDRVAAMNVIVMDENKWGKHDYTNEMAYDYDHLSYLGAIQLTHRVDSLIQVLEKP